MGSEASGSGGPLYCAVAFQLIRLMGLDKSYHYSAIYFYFPFFKKI